MSFKSLNIVVFTICSFRQFLCLCPFCWPFPALFSSLSFPSTSPASTSNGARCVYIPFAWQSSHILQLHHRHSVAKYTATSAYIVSELTRARPPSRPPCMRVCDQKRCHRTFYNTDESIYQLFSFFLRQCQVGSFHFHSFLVEVL